MTIAELEQVIDYYGKEVYGFCLHLTGSRQEAEELYQDTFLKVTELVHKIKKEGNTKSYLLSVAIRLWKNRIRKHAWRQRIAGMESIEEEESGQQVICAEANVSPEEQILLKEQILFVQKSIREMDEKYRLPVCLYYSANLSVNEIAECLKLPQGTVKSRLHKARTIIKEKMEVEGYDE